MKPHPFGLAVLFDVTLWLAVAGIMLVLRGLLLPDWGHVSSGGTIVALSVMAGALTVLLSLND
jgi:hypothetical protein